MDWSSSCLAVASCRDSEPNGGTRRTDTRTASSSFFLKARFNLLTQSLGRGIGEEHKSRTRHSQRHRRKSDPGHLHD